jgi:hypothetical protein
MLCKFGLLERLLDLHAVVVGADSCAHVMIERDLLAVVVLHNHCMLMTGCREVESSWSMRTHWQTAQTCTATQL